MEVFSQQDYYPVPSASVITYGKADTECSSKKKVLKADLYALIVHLSSPIDTVNYTVISDFFLIYRNFVSPMELSDLLVMRFRWCINEICPSNEVSEERQKIGEIALVRTFVLLRHWILNYFVQNFLPDVNLRLRIIKFLNEPCSSYPRIVKSTLINLKKAWIHCSKLMWTNLILDEPRTTGQEGRWEEYQIKDYTQLEDLRKRDSQLSTFAKNGSSSPNFRNQSVLSLFKNTDVFKIPDADNDRSNRTLRTASMVLFPCDNSNIKTETNKVIRDRDEIGKEPDLTILNCMHSEHRRKISDQSKMTSVSSVIKDIRYPLTPKIDKVIPPTPAKKVELILNLREGADSKVSIDNNKNGKTVNEKQPCKVDDSAIHFPKHLGAIGLLTKWRKNHSPSKRKYNGSQSNVLTNGYTKPEMDNFVKYVISITSLENRAQENEELESLVSSKFDILSARTIEEVEYLVSLENDLAHQVTNKVKNEPKKSTEDLIHDNWDEDQNPVVSGGFSAMDNLNLYQTVSSIANSVVTLSNNLNQHNKIQNSTFSPSHAALERRKIQSSMPAVSYSKSRLSMPSQTNSRKGGNLNELGDGPQRLVFHDSDREVIGLTASDPSLHLSTSKSRRSQSPSRSSPLRQVLPRLNENGFSSTWANNTEESSISSSVTYDSQLSDFFPQGTQTLPRLSGYNAPNDIGLKRKEAQNNLREFTFECQREDDVDDVDSASSFVTTRETIDDSSPVGGRLHEKLVRPASGRISLAKKQSILSHSGRDIRESTPERIMKDPDFIQKDKELLHKELELVQLQKETILRSSMTTSINTNVLFASKNNSPKKMVEADSLQVGLSTTPSMRSIDGENSNSTRVTGSVRKSFEVPDANRDDVKERLREFDPEISVDSSFSYLGINDPDRSIDGADPTETKNKYLFSPDSGSVDIASPAKNVEELKDKFLNKVDDKKDTASESEKSQITANNIVETAEREIAELKAKALNQENIVSIVNLPDDSVHDDPVNVALMKLEGKYEKTAEGAPQEREGSLTASVLANEVDILGIADLSVPHLSPADRRKSLLIERRRQTIMNFPFTPSSDKKGAESDYGRQKINAKELLEKYELKDPNLLVANREQHVSFILMYDSLSIAQQMTLIERELLGEVDWNELLNLNLTHTAPDVTSWLQLLVQNESLSGIDLAISRFNLTVSWVISEIVLTYDLKLKRNTIQRFIHVAEHCRVFQNYNTMMEIVLALSSIDVQKFSDAWRLIEPGDLVTWEELKQVPSLDRNYSSIRKLLNNVNPLKGCVPFIVVYLSDISLNSEKRNWFVENQVVNYNKFDTNVQIVKNFIQRVQWSKYYNFPVDHELLSKCVYLTSLTASEITQLTNQTAEAFKLSTDR